VLELDQVRGREQDAKRPGRVSNVLRQAALLGEFFVDGLDEFGDVEGFFEDATGAKEFRDVKKVAVALGAGHGDDFRIEIFPRQL
jgi:hypothetical protein